MKRTISELNSIPYFPLPAFNEKFMQLYLKCEGLEKQAREILDNKTLSTEQDLHTLRILNNRISILLEEMKEELLMHELLIDELERYLINQSPCMTDEESIDLAGSDTETDEGFVDDFMDT